MSELVTTMVVEERTDEHRRRGRPRKDPKIARSEKELAQKEQDAKIQELLDQAVSLFAVPFDDRDERPVDAPTISSVAEAMNTSRMKVRKLLITANYYSSDYSRRISELQKSGCSLEEICRKVKLGRAAVHSYLPYQKVIYKMDSPSENANHCMQFQLRKKTSAKLRDHLDEESLWETVKAFNNYIFHSADGQKYSYTVDGEMVCFSSVILSRKEIESAFNQALRTQNECDRMDLLPFGKGAEELNTVFHRIGVYNEKA